MKPKRIQRKRTRGWRLPKNAKCVTRPGVFGNPFPLDDNREAVKLFRWAVKGRWNEIKEKLKNLFPSAQEFAIILTMVNLQVWRKKMMNRLPELRGKDLACWCGLDDVCHADVLLEICNAPEEK